MIRLSTCVVLAALSLAAALPVRAAQLEKVVVVMRHGVRAPTKTTEWLSQYSREPWFSWPVAPGILTPHGAEGAEAMGAKLRAFYAGQKLLSENLCENKADVYVWADSADSRTRLSGDAAARGLLGKCAAPAHFLAPAGAEDPVFSHEGNKACQLDPAKAKASLLAAAGGDLNHLGPEYEAARKALLRIVYPGLKVSDCQGKRAPRACELLVGENRFEANPWKIKLTGPLDLGASLSENLLLEYAERHPLSAVGWGRATKEADLAAILPLHDIYARLTRENLYYASRRGGVLTAEIAALMAGGKADFAGAAPVPEQAKFVLLLGHDSNLSNLRGILGLNWTLPEEPDVTAPDTALAFERWRAADGSAFVRVRIFSFRLKDLRARGTAARGEVQTLKIPLCSKGKETHCSVRRFTDFALSRLSKSCFAPKVP